MPVSAISTYILSGNVININDISIIKEGFWREVQGSDAAEYLFNLQLTFLALSVGCLEKKKLCLGTIEEQ